MKIIVVIALAVALCAAAGGFLWWYQRTHQRPRHRVTALIALRREPYALDGAVLAKTAGRVWKADLGDGSTEGADGFVDSASILSTIRCGNYLFLVNSLPQPYVPDVEGAAKGIGDLRLRELFSGHRAWFSIEALNVDDTTSPAEVAVYYRLIGKLFAEFLDDNCLLIFVPESSDLFAINDQTLEALDSEEPLEALRQTRTAPMTAISPDDPRMKAAEAKARESFPRFVAAFEKREGKTFPSRRRLPTRTSPNSFGSP